MADDMDIKDSMTDLALEHPIEGDITVPGAPDEEGDELSTLDEPVTVTIKRDLKAVGIKFFHVLWPRQSKTLLREWDLWGPLVLCILLGMMLQGSSANDTDDGGPQFAEVFVIVTGGAVIVTLNSQLLGGTISFFQSVCVLGYCILPLNLASIICRVVLLAHQTTALFVIRFILVFAAFVWSTLASMAFLGDSQPVNRKSLAVYPMCLFYFIIGWMILSHTHS
ncbi:protein YIPF6-like [Ptychodera flava]|uniref:protein YIPF6-like n=1 Tax=Ptychodera flava TaxID=63121 RepID=UPI00396AA520